MSLRDPKGRGGDLVEIVQGGDWLHAAAVAESRNPGYQVFDLVTLYKTANHRGVTQGRKEG